MGVNWLSCIPPTLSGGFSGEPCIDDPPVTGDVVVEMSSSASRQYHFRYESGSFVLQNGSDDLGVSLDLDCDACEFTFVDCDEERTAYIFDGSGSFLRSDPPQLEQSDAPSPAGSPEGSVSTQFSKTDESGNKSGINNTYAPFPGGGFSLSAAIPNGYRMWATTTFSTIHGATTYFERVRFDYYAAGEEYGSAGDLKTATKQVRVNNQWVTKETYYYRYYLDGQAGGIEHGLKYVLYGDAYDRLRNDPRINNPLTAPDSVVAQYADNYFEYDAEGKVIKSVTHGGAFSYENTYTESAFTDDYNNWKYKLVVDRPDGSQRITYGNYLYEPIVAVLKDGGDEWVDYSLYDSEGRLIQHAHPSAVESYDENEADMGVVLNTNLGRIDVTDYYASTTATESTPGGVAGYVQFTKIKEGSEATEIKLSETTYFAREAGGATSYPIAESSVFRNDDGSGQITTSYAYEYWSGYTRIQQKTTTLPVISTGQNGSGTANEQVEIFDFDGRVIWIKDERGFITYHAYDDLTDALVQTIQDVDMSLMAGYSQEPDWTTPVGGGLHLITDYESDIQGRTNQTLGPWHDVEGQSVRTASWTVYKDETNETLSAQGYAIGPEFAYEYTLVGPVSISQVSADGLLARNIAAIRCGSTGRLSVSDCFPQSSWVRWSESRFNGQGQMVSSRTYFEIPANGAGELNINYNESSYGYDVMGRRNRQVSPGGTITRTVFDVRGNVIWTYVGTNDTGAADADPTGGGAAGNNMVPTTARIYDFGRDAGDNLLTQAIQYVGAFRTNDYPAPTETAIVADSLIRPDSTDLGVTDGKYVNGENIGGGAITWQKYGDPWRINDGRLNMQATTGSVKWAYVDHGITTGVVATRFQLFKQPEISTKIYFTASEPNSNGAARIEHLLSTGGLDRIVVNGAPAYNFTVDDDFFVVEAIHDLSSGEFTVILLNSDYRTKIWEITFSGATSISGTFFSVSNGANGQLTKGLRYLEIYDTVPADFVFSAPKNRITDYIYDFRGRQTAVVSEEEFTSSNTYDNLGQVTEFSRSHGGVLIGLRKSFFDDLGRTYSTETYAVDASTGTVGNHLYSLTWYDASGHTIKRVEQGAKDGKAFTKLTYDGLGRQIAQYAGYFTGTGQENYSEASAIGSTSRIFQQSYTTYDEAGNVIETAAYQRFHTATGGGELNLPNTIEPKARVSYLAYYYDGVGRQIATANYGTNDNVSFTRPGAAPAASDDVLVSLTLYNGKGEAHLSTDPAGMATRTDYDDAGRPIRTIQNYVAGECGCEDVESSGEITATDCECSAENACCLDGGNDENVMVETVYNADSQVAKLIAKNPTTGDQITQYLYGTTLEDSEIARNDLLVGEIYPDAVDATDRVTYTYDRTSARKSKTDQNGTVHEYAYDNLGRRTADRITTIAYGVDDSVQRIETSYGSRGLVETVTCYDAATAGTVVNEVEYAFNDFGQLITEYEAHGGAVDTGTTPTVQYSYSDGSENTIRSTGFTYPNGNTLAHSYGTTDGDDDLLSRIVSLTHSLSPADPITYDYFGLGSVYKIDYTEPEVDLDYAADSGSNPYVSLDRFGRVIDMNWENYNTSTSLDHIQYGYDRASNRTWRKNLVAPAGFDELYGYDGLHRLKTADRGQLSSDSSRIESNFEFHQAWDLDATGNWSGFEQFDQDDASQALIQQRTHNEVNEIIGIGEAVGPQWITPEHDRNGNMTLIPQPAAPTTSFDGVYDPWNRLVKLTESDSENVASVYYYDGVNRRMKTDEYDAGVFQHTRHFYFNHQWQNLEERIDSSTDAERQYVWGIQYIDQLHYRRRDTDGNGTLDEELWAMQDGNWNVVGIFDNTTSVHERYQYTAYGNMTFYDGGFAIHTSSNFKWTVSYTGQHRMKSSMYDFRNRMYSSLTGTFARRDPLTVADGPNLYRAYFAPNGLDPYGTVWIYVGAGAVLIGGVWIYLFDPEGSFDALSLDEFNSLHVIKHEMMRDLQRCATHKDKGGDDKQMLAIASAIDDCPISGKFEQGGAPDGSDATSITWDPGPAFPSRVILSKDFFNRPKCSQYKTLLKECYRRVALRDFDDTGKSDNRNDNDFEAIECCLECCGTVNPVIRKGGSTGCCPCKPRTKPKPTNLPPVTIHPPIYL